MAVVLIVQRDRDMARQYAAWLERAGFETAICTGPWPPTYYCPLLETGGCSLCAAADIFVYDPWLYVRPDGSGAADLIRTLRRAYPDRPVLLTWGQPGIPEAVVRQETDPWVREAPSDPAGLVEAVRRTLAEYRHTAVPARHGPRRRVLPVARLGPPEE